MLLRNFYLVKPQISIKYVEALILCAKCQPAQFNDLVCNVLSIAGLIALGLLGLVAYTPKGGRPRAPICL